MPSNCFRFLSSLHHGAPKEIKQLTSACIEQLDKQMKQFGVSLTKNQRVREELKEKITDALIKLNANDTITPSDLRKNDQQFIATHFANQVTAQLLGCSPASFEFNQATKKVVSTPIYLEPLITAYKNKLWDKIPQAHPSREDKCVVNHRCASDIQAVFQKPGVALLLNNAIQDWHIFFNSANLSEQNTPQVDHSSHAYR